MMVGAISLGVYLWSRSIFLSYAITGGLSFGTLASFLIVPILGCRHFILAEYWVLIPVIIWTTMGAIVEIVIMTPSMPKKNSKT